MTAFRTQPIHLYRLLAAFLPLLSSHPTRAAPPLTLRYASDVPGSLVSPNSSFPGSFTRSGPNLYFVASTPELGYELWVYDSSPHLVKDIVPGSARALLPTTPIAPLPDGRAVFFADDGLGLNTTLWVTNGTAEGTRRLNTHGGTPAIVPNPTQTGPFAALASGRVLYMGYDPATGVELYSTDGTDAGTDLVADLSPGPFSSSISFLHSAGNIAYFSSGGFVWRTDGTAANTFVLGQWSSMKFLNVGAATYFISPDANAATRGLWITDGTTAGTRRLVDPLNTTPELAAVGPYLIYSGYAVATGNEPWAFNTLTSVAAPLADIQPGAAYSDPHNFASLGSLVIFHAVSPAEGREPWVTDGTPAGTHLLLDIRSGTDSGIHLGSGFQSDGAHAYFQTYEPGAVLVTDGTSAGTIPIATATSLSSSGPTGAFLPDGSGRFLFALADAATGTELLISDATSAGTHSFDIAPGTSSVALPSGYRSPHNRRPAAVLGDRVFFPAPIPFGSRTQIALASASVAPGDATIIRPFAGGLIELAAHAGRVYFPAADTSSPSNVELWSSDGSAGGTSLVANISPLSSSFPRSLTSVGNRLFCAASTAATDFGAGPFTLFASVAGMPGAAQVVSNASSGLARIRLSETSSLAAPEDFTAAFGKLFFVGSTDPANSFGPLAAFASDGTDAGTTRLVQVASRTSFIETRGRVYFVGIDEVAGSNSVFLLSTDGTLAGTTLEAPVRFNSLPIAATATHIFLYSPDAASIPQLVAMDLTTHAITDLTSFTGVQGTVGLSSFNSGVVGDRVVFSANDGAGGRELWSSDGTAVGTGQIADLVPGPTGSAPATFTPGRNVLLFLAAAPDGVGRILYRTDGTPSGTHPVPNHPGAPSLSRFALTDYSLVPSPGNTRVYAIAANSTAQQVWYIDTCVADFDASGAVTIDDLFAFLAAWFAQDPHADTNASGDLTPTDIFSFIAAWFAGCD